MEAAPKRVIGRPFQKGQSGNPGGRKKALFTEALMKRLTPESADKIMAQVQANAEKGEAWAIQMLWDRLEGKAIGRQESGAPGEFTGLEDLPTPELLKIINRTA